jgi:hypothetical protein
VWIDRSVGFEHCQYAPAHRPVHVPDELVHVL